MDKADQEGWERDLLLPGIVAQTILHSRRMIALRFFRRAIACQMGKPRATNTAPSVPTALMAVDAVAGSLQY